MSTSEALKKARKDYRNRQKAAGSKLSAFMLSAEALAALDKLATNGVSKAQAVNAALISAANEKALREAGEVAVRERVVLDVSASVPPVHPQPEPGVTYTVRDLGPDKPAKAKANPGSLGRLKGHWKAP